jgi:hypothetical protein
MSKNDPVLENRCDELDFDARIRFPQVIQQEYTEIAKRRKRAEVDAPAAEDGRPRNLIGISLSGGGVRSATFNLGMLQALAAAGKLRMFDYLSTVSGGGYVGGWWSAWLSRRERENEPMDQIFPPPEDIESERDERRAQKENEDAHPDSVDRPQIKDSAINAGKDPIHHLRLFSNVMTPRKGLLSADTWRAAAVIFRNIVLTWLILVPILLAAIMIGQSFFTLLGDKTIKEVLFHALAIPGLLFLGNVVSVVFWMLFGRQWKKLSDKFVVILSTLTFFLLTLFLMRILDVKIPVLLWVVLIAWVIYIVARVLWWKFIYRPNWYDGGFWRNRMTMLQTKTLSYSVFTLVIFLFAGFGYRIFEFLLHETEHAVTRAGGWSAFALGILSSIYTALKASPTGGGDNSKAKPPSKLQQLIFAIAPTLLLLLLGVVLSWIGRQLYLLVVNDKTDALVELVTRGALVSGLLFLIFALYEFRPQQKWKSLVVIAAWEVVMFGAIGVDASRIIPIGVLTLVLLSAALIFRSILRRKLWILGYAALLAVIAFLIWKNVNPAAYSLNDTRFPQFVLGGIAATLVLLIFELIQGRGVNTRCIALTVIGCTIFVFVGAALGAGTLGRDALTLVGLIATILGWVIALGWLADPNLLTMHGFYKARLIRAYMGASNVARGKAKDADITDAVPGDDMLLTQLRNTDRGAPYHLINTMLNLVGGSDLSTQARASDSFLMSKLYCGSMRTGYRPTAEYSCGNISLGTAVAVSGAAASPNMGGQTPSAALSALMTLFNIRLGYWAPTPNLSYWRSATARLWPVYTLQELVSQTTDLLPYCNLTDGGHYENTGVYSLIQRGCRLIIVGDCGADPDTTLDDLGNLIRKVRIDFGTEIELDIKPFRPDPLQHVIVGRIKYGPDHAKALGLKTNDDEAKDETIGTLIVVKPNRAGGDPVVPVDVLQYGFLNKDFPQQNTFDLWYDEAQFESYRRLGMLSGKVAAAEFDQAFSKLS